MKKISFLLFVLCTSVAAFAQTWTADKAHSKVGFTVTHFAISEVDGMFKTFDAKITSSKEDFSDAIFEFSADISSVTTSNDGRDAHLQKPDMFDGAQFPKMTFKSTSISKVADKKFKMTGDLTIKGVTKSVTLDLVHLGSTVNQRNKKIAGFKATGSIKRTDFGVGAMPSLVVSEDIELRASGEFVAN